MFIPAGDRGTALGWSPPPSPGMPKLHLATAETGAGFGAGTPQLSRAGGNTAEKRDTSRDRLPGKSQNRSELLIPPAQHQVSWLGGPGVVWLHFSPSPRR